MELSGASSRVRSAASSWPMSRRAPASTIVISAFGLGGNFATDGLLASFTRLVGLAERAVAVGHDRRGRPWRRSSAWPPAGRPAPRRSGPRRTPPRRPPRAPRRAAARGPARPGCAGRRSRGPRRCSSPAAARCRATRAASFSGRPLSCEVTEPVELGAGDVLGQVRAVVVLPAPWCASPACPRAASSRPCGPAGRRTSGRRRALRSRRSSAPSRGSTAGSARGLGRGRLAGRGLAAELDGLRGRGCRRGTCLPVAAAGRLATRRTLAAVAARPRFCSWTADTG